MKGTFVGYSNSSKAYRIYMRDRHHIEVSRDVIFDESIAFNFKKSKELSVDSDDEELPIFEEEVDQGKEESHHEEEGPCEPIQPVVIPETRKIPNWLKSTLLDAEGHRAATGSFRESKKPKRYFGYTAYMTKLIEAEPSSFEEDVNNREWKDVMNEEYQSIMKNGVWEIVPRPKDKFVVTSKWIYKIKHAGDGSIDKYKARFVARGFSQLEGIDYEETFAPTAKYTTIQSLVSLATSMGWNIHQMDVKTAFLNGTIDEEVYIEQPLGSEVKDRKAYVCRLKKELYGLKQAPRAWYARMDAYLQRIGFTKSTADSNLYIKVVDGKPVIILLYVDDLLLIGVEGRIEKCKKQLAAEFDMKDLGLMHYYLGLEVWQGPNEVYLGQGKYMIEILKRFDMMDYKPMTTPMITNLKRLGNPESSPVDPSKYRQLIGSLMYLVNTRADICFAVNVLSQFQVEPKHDHWVAAKHIMRYLQGTIHYYLKYDRRNDVQLIGYIDSDWGGSEQDGRSTTGGCFSLGSSMVSWMSRTQDSVALSSVEVEYVAACEVSREALWLRKLIFGLFEGPMNPTVIHCDNTSCIHLSEDLVFHGKINHINKYHYVRELVQNGVLKLQYISTDEQVPDILTKSLPNKKLVYLRDKLGLVDVSSPIERER